VPLNTVILSWNRWLRSRFEPSLALSSSHPSRRTPTLPEKAWFAYSRLYCPEQPCFDRSWHLPDLELVE
jgi:hypothetical protein